MSWFCSLENVLSKLTWTEMGEGTGFHPRKIKGHYKSLYEFPLYYFSPCYYPHHHLHYDAIPASVLFSWQATPKSTKVSKVPHFPSYLGFKGAHYATKYCYHIRHSLRNNCPQLSPFRGRLKIKSGEWREFKKFSDWGSLPEMLWFWSWSSF